MNYRTATFILLLATLVMIAAGCVPPSAPDSWTAVVLVTGEDKKPCFGVYVEVCTKHPIEPHAVPFTNRDGLVFVRVRAGDSIHLPDYDGAGRVVGSHGSQVYKFGVPTEEEADK